MLALLAEALEWIYDQHPNPARPPTLEHLVAAVQAVVRSKGYSVEVESNFIAMFEARLGVLIRRLAGRILVTETDAPGIEELMESQSILELSTLPPEQACLITFILLTLIIERLKSTPWSGGGIRLVIVLEEAHNLIGPSTDASASAENADPKAFASELIVRCLAELRSLGVAIIIMDQHPSAIAPAVVKHVTWKLTFRTSDVEGRETLGGGMLFDPIQMEEVARLRPGQAFFFTDGYFKPMLLQTTHIEKEWNLPRPPVGDEVLPYLADEPWFIETSNARLADKLTRLRNRMDEFDGVRQQLATRAARLANQHPAIIAGAPANKRSTQLTRLRNEAHAVRAKLDAALSKLRRDYYRPLVGREPPPGVVDESLMALRNHLMERFALAIVPATQACLSVLDRLIRRCGEKAAIAEGE